MRLGLHLLASGVVVAAEKVLIGLSALIFDLALLLGLLLALLFALALLLSLLLALLSELLLALFLGLARLLKLLLTLLLGLALTLCLRLALLDQLLLPLVGNDVVEGDLVLGRGLVVVHEFETSVVAVARQLSAERELA